MSTATSWPTEEVDVDADPRVVIVAPDLAAALTRDVGARKFFVGLTYSCKRWHVLSIEGAKTSESRRRRIGKSVTMLRGGRAR
jgi:uncharacterized protein YdeI (YjbR/CyaY-like superfamily)